MHYSHTPYTTPVNWHGNRLLICFVYMTSDLRKRPNMTYGLCLCAAIVLKLTKLSVDTAQTFKATVLLLKVLLDIKTL